MTDQAMTPPAAPANWKQVQAAFDRKPEAVRTYFPAFPRLIQEFGWDVCVSYVYSRVEVAKHMTIYCGIVKIHWTDSTLTRDLIDKDHMTRGRFRELFKIVYRREIEGNLLLKLSSGEAVRDKVAHGKNWTEQEARSSLVNAFDFAESFNEFVFGIAQFRPFGSLTGFKGRAEALSPETTRWVLKGMGIPAKA